MYACRTYTLIDIQTDRISRPYLSSHIYMSACLPTYLPTHFPIYLSAYLSVYLFICLSMMMICLPPRDTSPGQDSAGTATCYLSVYLSAVDLFVHLST